MENTSKIDDLGVPWLINEHWVYHPYLWWVHDVWFGRYPKNLTKDYAPTGSMGCKWCKWWTLEQGLVIRSPGLSITCDPSDDPPIRKVETCESNKNTEKCRMYITPAMFPRLHGDWIKTLPFQKENGNQQHTTSADSRGRNARFTKVFSTRTMWSLPGCAVLVILIFPLVTLCFLTILQHSYENHGPQK